MSDLHSIEDTIAAGASLDSAKAALILIHGRGATAESILPLGEAFAVSDLAVIAPQASANTWYPYTFLAPTDANEPWLSSALALIGALVAQLGERGFPPEKIALAGFSQGACLATEFSARNARRYGAILGFSGGLIGPPGTPRNYKGSLGGTPVFLGCSDVDPHIPLERVDETAEVLEKLGGTVDKRIYPGSGHSVNEDEITAAKKLLATLAADTTH